MSTVNWKEKTMAPLGTDEIAPVQAHTEDDLSKGECSDQDFEVFKSTEDGVNYRVLNWQWASIIFLKREFL